MGSPPSPEKESETQHMMEVKCVTSICSDNAFIVVYAITLTDPESARHLKLTAEPPEAFTKWSGCL